MMSLLCSGSEGSGSHQPEHQASYIKVFALYSIPLVNIAACVQLRLLQICTSLLSAVDGNYLTSMDCNRGEMLVYIPVQPYFHLRN